MRAFLGGALVIAFALVVGAQQFGDMLLPWKPFGSYGFSANTFGDVKGVFPGSPAARAGIETGDTIDISALTYHERRRIMFLSLAPSGETMTIPVIHAGVRREVTLTAATYTRTPADNVTDILETAERLVLLAIAVFLVLRRPSLLTASFFCIAVSSVGAASIAAWASDGELQAFTAISNAAFIAGSCASIVFAMMFPRTTPSRAVVRTAYALGAFALVWWLVDAAFNFAMLFDWSTSTNVPALHVLFATNVYLPVALYAVAVAAFIANYTHSSAADRLRMQWVAFGFIIGSLGTFAAPLAAILFSWTPPLWLQNSILTLNIFIPITVAYAILKHHVVDVRFFLSRALVYSAITGVAVVALVLLEILVAKQLEGYHLALVVEVAGALAVGLGIQRMHKAIDDLVDRFVFRSIHVAEIHLGNIGEAMMFANGARQIDEMLRYESQRALDLSDVHVIRDIAETDHLGLRLQAARAPIVVDHDLVIAFMIRHRLYGYARFGTHRNGAAIDPNERELLERLCHRAALAYDHVTSEERSAENERLRIENDLLRSLVPGPVSRP